MTALAVEDQDERRVVGAVRASWTERTAAIWRASSLRPVVATRTAIARAAGFLSITLGVLTLGNLWLSRSRQPHLHLLFSFAVVYVLAGIFVAVRGEKVSPDFYRTCAVLGNLSFAPIVYLSSGGIDTLSLATCYVFGNLICFILFTWRTAIFSQICFQVIAFMTLSLMDFPAAVIFAEQGSTVGLAVTVGWLVRAASVADRDALTDLANRRGLEHAMNDALRVAERTGDPLSIAVFDFDGFKKLNDTMGHAAGDRLLQDVTGAWRMAVRGRQTLARLGGDEFALVLPACGVARAIELADLMRGLALEAGPIKCSAGVAQWQAGDSVSLLLGRADAALYDAKNRGRDQTAHAGDDDHERVELLRALADGEFEIFYQPIVAMADGRQTGAEALIRWRHPQRGLVSPLEFIPAAERSGAIRPIGEWVLNRACADIAALISQTNNPFRVSVNASGLELVQTGYAEQVRQALQDSGLPAAALVIEVTESSLDADQVHVIATLQALRGVGVGVAIDDFGTGYSTLSRLDRLPANIVKVDQSFVRAISADRPDNPILTAIVSLAQALGMESLAEGVETQEQAQTLRQLGFKSAQGYLYGKPRPLELSMSAAPSGARPLPTALKPR